jgi:SPOR domain
MGATLALLNNKVGSLQKDLGPYGIVVSAANNKDGVIPVVQYLKSHGFPDVVVYHRQRSYRTVAANFKDRAEAQKKLPDIQRYRRTAYVVNLSTWCYGPEDSGEKVAGMGIQTCRDEQLPEPAENHKAKA